MRRREAVLGRRKYSSDFLRINAQQRLVPWCQGGVARVHHCRAANASYDTLETDMQLEALKVGAHTCVARPVVPDLPGNTGMGRAFLPHYLISIDDNTLRCRMMHLLPSAASHHPCRAENGREHRLGGSCHEELWPFRFAISQSTGWVAKPNGGCPSFARG